MQLRDATLPDSYEPLIRDALKKRGFSLDEPRRLAECVLRLSDFYLENPSAQTPWGETWAQAASIVYYFPLNYSRNALVARETSRLGFFDGLSSAVDDGAGMGSALHAFSDRIPDLDWAARDISKEALSLLNELGLPGRPGSTDPSATDPSAGGALDRSRAPLPAEVVVGTYRQKAPRDLLVASYVLTELKAIPREWLEYEALIIVEPSTREDARRLQCERKTLLEAGFSLWAPCPHHDDCPLLVSDRDWCHDRVHFGAPAWFTEIEKHLPIKNRTLGFSYLAARKKTSPVRRLARLVGDTLIEKGKSRQALCRSSKREFLAWFPQRFTETSPDGARTKNLEMSRGSLVRLAPDLEKRQQEVRLKEPSQVEELGTDEPV